MPRTNRRSPRRQRVGRVSVYLHHGSWHIYYREGRRPVRRRVSSDPSEALRVAAEVNAQLAAALPPTFSFVPLTVTGLRQRFLEYHESVLNSSLATVNRYRTATKYLDDFAGHALAHKIDPDLFVRHLRSIQVAPNGHPHAVKRPLREKGVRFILETCRSLYGFAVKKRHLPPYYEITFAPPGLRRRGIEDAKPVFVFDSRSEVAFFEAVSAWALPIFLTLAKTGLRTGELIHTLVEDLDLDSGWWHVRNKPGLNWSVKTRRDRSVPLVPELVDILRRLLTGRKNLRASGQRRATSANFSAVFRSASLSISNFRHEDTSAACSIMWPDKVLDRDKPSLFDSTPSSTKWPSRRVAATIIEWIKCRGTSNEWVIRSALSMPRRRILNTPTVCAIVDELDLNVPPESTFQLADAHIKAGKDFDL